MSELNDSSELQRYSSAVLYVLSAVTPPPEYVDVIAERFWLAIRSSDVCTANFSLSLSILISVVMAHTIERFANVDGLLLPQSNECIPGDPRQDHGRFIRLSR